MQKEKTTGGVKAKNTVPSTKERSVKSVKDQDKPDSAETAKAEETTKKVAVAEPVGAFEEAYARIKSGKAKAITVTEGWTDDDLGKAIRSKVKVYFDEKTPEFPRTLIDFAPAEIRDRYLAALSTKARIAKAAKESEDDPEEGVGRTVPIGGTVGGLARDKMLAAQELTDNGFVVKLVTPEQLLEYKALGFSQVKTGELKTPFREEFDHSGVVGITNFLEHGARVDLYAVKMERNRYDKMRQAQLERRNERMSPARRDVRAPGGFTVVDRGAFVEDKRFMASVTEDTYSVAERER
jgi:hypothetical protein